MSPARERELFNLARSGTFDPAELSEALASLQVSDLTEALPKNLSKAAGQEVAAKRWADNDNQRWVPIGPSVVRRGQASGRPRVVGRVKDLAVSSDGMRAYAGSGLGGVWYTGDAGHSWIPVGGWAPANPFAGGNFNARAVGSMLVHFDPGDDPTLDFVVVGTGEPPPGAAPVGEGNFAGLGVLSGFGPATRTIDADPWEARPDTAQVRLFEGIGFYRMARRPGRTPGSTVAGSEDEILAATSGGLFRGVRRAVGPPADGNGEYAWTRVVGVDALPGMGANVRQVTDVVWHSGGRVVIAVHRRGVAFSTDNGTSFNWVTGCAPVPAPGTQVQGRLSLAEVPGTNRIYVLAPLPPPAVANPPTDTPALFRIADITVAAPAAVLVGNAAANSVPANLWGGQAFYDQAIVVDPSGTRDRVFLGGSFHEFPANEFLGGVWCFEVDATPALVPVPGISTTAAPAPPVPIVGAGADAPGLIGNNIHPDIHAIKLAGAGATAHVWVGCDGGVFVSRHGGRTHTFASRCNGLAALQPTFLAQHPTSSHFVASGFQDAGMEVRSGDTVWDKVALGDGGGTVFHPTRPQHIVGQTFNHGWRKVPDTNFTMPTRTNATGDVENGQTLFYSGAAAVARPTGGARICVGTSRVWMTENVGGAIQNTWRVLPFPVTAAAAAAGELPSDPRDDLGNDNTPNFGIPSLVAGGADVVAGVGPLGGVLTLRWVTPTELLVLFVCGIVRWNETGGRWRATVLLSPATQPGTAASGASPTTLLTDIAPVPGTQDFYLTTTGDLSDATIDTCYHFTGGAFNPTGLRNSLPVPPGSAAGAAAPLEPAYSVALDTVAPATVYVGTVTGVWNRAHPAPAGTVWNRFDNGLPQAAVQDLSIWTDPSPVAGVVSPRLLRAAVQSRGLWESNLAATEPPRTYVRVHARDDRRRFPTPMANPRRGPGTTEENTFESPDIVVRPRANAGIVPPWTLGTQRIHEGNLQTYQLWTFQTAFRWLYPSVVADGQWTDTFGDLLEFERARRGLAASVANPVGQRFIDKALWDAVIQNTRVQLDTGLPSTADNTDTGLPAAVPADEPAVLRPAWHTPSRTLTGDIRRTVPATEIDLLETVQPRSILNGVWQVHSEVSTVDVLLHHRDMRAVPENGAFAILLSRSGPNREALLNSPGSDLPALAADLLAGNVHAAPAGWTVEDGNVVGRTVHRLPVTLDARMPRAVSIDVNLSDVGRNHFVLFLAIVGSSADMFAQAPLNLPATPSVRQVVRRWPYAALRLVQVAPRPPANP